MATNHTENYELNQWLATDQVQRTDFNADNAKIDAALLNKIGPIELIAETATTSIIQYFTLDLTGVDWSQWRFAVAVADPVRYTAEFSTVSLVGPLVSVLKEVTGELSPDFGPEVYLFFPMKDGERPLRYLAFPGGKIMGSVQGTYNDITGIRVSSSHSNGLKQGSSIKLYGVK